MYSYVVVFFFHSQYWCVKKRDARSNFKMNQSKTMKGLLAHTLPTKTHNSPHLFSVAAIKPKPAASESKASLSGELGCWANKQSHSIVWYCTYLSCEYLLAQSLP